MKQTKIIRCVLQISQVRKFFTSDDWTVWKVRDDGWNGRWLEGGRRCFDFIGNRQGLTSGVQAKVSQSGCQGESVRVSQSCC